MLTDSLSFLEKFVDETEAQSRCCLTDLGPILLTHNLSARARRRESLEKLHLDLNAKCAIMDRIESKVIRLGQILRQRRINAAVALVPAMSLPPEILRVIFAFTVHSDISPTVLSHVSSVWRSVALSQSALWTRINTLASRPERLNAWICRSDPQPLDIVLHFPSTPRPSWLQSAHAHSRLNSLVVYHRRAEHTFFDQLRLCGGGFGSLKRLVIEKDDSEDSSDDMTDPISFLDMKMPYLETLRITGSRITHLRSIANSLTELYLSNVDMNRPDWPPIFETYGLRLRKVTLKSISCDASLEEGPGHPWRLATLDSLNLLNCDATTIYHLMRRIVAPHLRHFTLETEEEDQDYDDEDGYEGWDDREVSAEDEWLSGYPRCFRSFRRFIAISPRLETVHISGWHNIIEHLFTCLLPRPASHTPSLVVPSLRHLAVIAGQNMFSGPHHHRAVVESLTQMLREFIQTHSTVEFLKVSSCMIDKDRDWFHKAVDTVLEEKCHCRSWDNCWN